MKYRLEPLGVVVWMYTHQVRISLLLEMTEPGALNPQ